VIARLDHRTVSPVYVGAVSAELSSSIHLRRTDENAADVDAATERFGRRVGVAGVLDHLDRQAERARVPGTAVDHGFRWSSPDQHDERWWPQGITTSADARGSEDVEGRRLVVTSWYAKAGHGNNLGSRVTVVDLDTLRYRHVLLVVPGRTSSGGVELRPLLVHAGGLVWCGPYLHVAGTRRGLLTCRMDDVIRVRSTDDTHGYRYVLPVRFEYTATAGHGVVPLRYSFLSLDRAARPPQLLAGEYGRGEMTRRLLRFPLDPDTLHLARHQDGISRPVALDERGLGHMQGAVLVGDTYYVTVSRGRYRLGHLYVGRPGAFRVVRRALPVGPEDISYWPSTDSFWSLSEYPSRRYVFTLRRADLG
jgi:hypothetical protein